MIIEKIRNSLRQKGFQDKKVNVNNIYLLCAAYEQKANVVVLFHCPKGEEYTGEQLRNIKRQLYNQFQEQFTSVELLCIILTERVEVIKRLWGEDDDHWIIDTRNYSLIIYENQRADFFGIKRIIEDTLYQVKLEESGRTADNQNTDNQNLNNQNSSNQNSNNRNTYNQNVDNQNYHDQNAHNDRAYNNDSRSSRDDRYGDRYYNSNNNGYDQQENPYEDPYHGDYKNHGANRNPDYGDYGTHDYGAYGTPEHNSSAYDPPQSRNYPPLRNYFSFLNTLIVVINILIFFILDNSIFVNGDYFISEGALYWPSVIYDHEFYRVFTYMFLHFGMEHITNNMLVLFVIGSNLERTAGKWRYLAIYFGSGLVAGIASMSYNMLNNTNVVSVGASGAIFGVVGAIAYIVIINKGRMENISTRQIILFAVVSLYGGLTSQGVDNAAHIGGLLAGILLAAVLYRKQKRKRQEGVNL